LWALLASCVLAHLEAALRRSSGDPNAHVADYFDLVACTGAGVVFATMLFSTHSRGAALFPATSSSTSPFYRGKKRPLAAPTAALEAAMKAAFGVFCQAQLHL
jgi:hypothetical protein